MWSVTKIGERESERQYAYAMPRDLWWSWGGGGGVLMSEAPLYTAGHAEGEEVRLTWDLISQNVLIKWF